MTTENILQSNDLIKALNLVGMDKEEAGVYLACLELGPASAWDIYLKSGVKRPTCYVVLDRLAIKGIASKSNDGKKTIFTVSSPKELMDLFEQKKTVFSQKIKELETLMSKTPQKPKIRFYEGEEGLKQAYNLNLDMQRGEEIILYSTNNSVRMFPDYFESYFAMRSKKGIKARGIFPDTQKNRDMLTPFDKIQLRESRYLSEEEYSPFIDVTIFGDKVLYTVYNERQPFATVIESNALARDERQRFELLWKSAQT